MYSAAVLRQMVGIWGPTPKQVRHIFVSCGSKENPDAVIKEAEDLNAAGIKATSYVSPDTAHEFLTWRRALKEMAQLLFK